MSATAAGLVRELLVGGRGDLGGGEERGDVDEEVLVPRAGQAEVDLVVPGALDLGQEVCGRDVPEAGPVVPVGVVAEDGAGDPVLGLAEPAVLEVLQYGLGPGLGAGDVAGVRHGDGEGATQEAAEVGGRVGEPVLLVVPAGEGDEDPEIVLPGSDADAGAGELGADLGRSRGR
ncbi:uncharacterized protein MCYG_08388 [Microsporum canis CBS 113480]|uniref:Uncharacterized protein n=1 Tax=Arthroderma otae (strain ATCC MYA-4605 / CBS 113480) TaxID=554155 RepID=C5G0B6_ARTOC|nr:uncharacterized protein MCYG_08388 [Microsporum canis CBS 113480]EEQ35569.1 predicted protein [Microsporum canis CBS 113480]